MDNMLTVETVCCEPQKCSGIDECSGRVYKCKKTAYLGARDKICYKVEFVPLKRNSCKCAVCSGLFYEVLDTLMSNCDPEDIFPSNTVDGALYRAEIYARGLWSGEDADQGIRFTKIDCGAKKGE